MRVSGSDRRVSVVREVVPVVGGTAVVMVSPLVMLPVVPGALLASVMATGVVMVFGGLLLGSAEDAKGGPRA